MRRITERVVEPWIEREHRCHLGMMITAVLLVIVVFGVIGEAGQQRLRPRRDGLTPAEERRANAGRPDPGRRVNEGRLDPLTREDREYMRLVPQGVAFPRVLIRVFRELDLTDDQRAKLENLAKRSGNQMPALNRLRKAQSELLDEALYGEAFEPATIEQRASDLAATQAEIIKLQARVMTQIRQILKPEQGQKFRNLLMRERDGQRQDNDPALQSPQKPEQDPTQKPPEQY
ncbi:MAG: Spy/CpxP family protein refolding chaperone [Acidobacteriota bacterium]